jgi:branched-subunit amino acid ABC-type transport system permease component
MFAPITLLSPDMMDGFRVTGFTAAIVGGIYSFPGAIFGGLLLGIITSISGIYVDPEWQAIISLLVLIGVLLWRPQGIFGTRMRTERV